MPIVWTQDPAANELLETDPLALLIGMVLDQQVKMEKAFGGPYELKRRLGHLDVRKIAGMDPENLDMVFRERPALHRFPGNMARRVQAMCAVVVKDYGGDAESVWRDAKDGDDLAARISKLPGFGEMKTKALGAVLAKHFRVKAAEGLVPPHPTLGDVDSSQALADYQASKRAHKAELRKAQAR